MFVYPLVKQEPRGTGSGFTYDGALSTDRGPGAALLWRCGHGHRRWKSAMRCATKEEARRDGAVQLRQVPPPVHVGR